MKQLEQPLLFLLGDNDKVCPLPEFSEALQDLPSKDIRVEIFEVNLILAKAYFPSLENREDYDFEREMIGFGPNALKFLRI